MNYIKLLNAACIRIFGDQRLNATHVSLYYALFQEWNMSRFANSFFINRQQLMQYSKIGSKGTYHRCINELHQWQYINYNPSNNPFKGSVVRMKSFIMPSETDEDLERIAQEFEQNSKNPGSSTENEPLKNSSDSSSEQVQNNLRNTSIQPSGPSLNKLKQAKNCKMPKDWQEVFIFFKDKGSNQEEAVKFMEFYNEHEWKTGNGVPVQNWKGIAKSWIAREFKKADPKFYVKNDFLKTKIHKNYEQPL